MLTLFNFLESHHQKRKKKFLPTKNNFTFFCITTTKNCQMWFFKWNYNFFPLYLTLFNFLESHHQKKDEKQFYQQKTTFDCFCITTTKNCQMWFFYRSQKLKNVAQKVTKWIIVVKSRVCQVMKIAYCTAALCVVWLFYLCQLKLFSPLSFKFLVSGFWVS